MKITFKKRLHGNSKLKQAFEAGFTPFKDYCLRYGKIITDFSYEASEGYYKGFNRKYEIFIDGMLCNIRMQNGAVKEIGYEYCDRFDQERVLKKLKETE